MKFAYIKDHRGVFDIGAMCAVFGVTAAGFYAWLKRPASARAVRANELAEQIRVVHHQTKGVYGSLKITKELRHRHVKVNRKTVARLMNRLGIRSSVSRKFRVRTTDSGLLHHSDRGVQYTSGRYRELLDHHGVEPSMSRTGNCYDNAVVESFWGKLKTEMVYHQHFSTKAQARAAVFEYIEMF